MRATTTPILRPLSLVLLLSACSVDVIDHPLEVPSSRDAGSLADAADQDAGPADSGAFDAGFEGCILMALDEPLDFGLVPVGQTSSLNLRVENAGMSACQIQSVSLADATVFSLQTPPTTPVLQPGQQTEWTIDFAPPSAGAFETTLNISSNDASKSVYAIPVRGYGPRPDAPSTQTITFRIQNDLLSDIYVVTSGWYCTPLDPGVPIALAFQCLCECANPGPPGPDQLQRLAPGGSYEITWDARRLDTYTHPVDCASRGWPGLGLAEETLGQRVPVSPGPRTVQIAFETQLPPDCMDDGSGHAYCVHNFGGGGETPPTVAELCPTSSVALATFSVPATGDVTVEVPITP